MSPFPIAPFSPNPQNVTRRNSRFYRPDMAWSPGVVRSPADYTVDNVKWPKLAAYIERVHNTPAFQKAMSLDKKLFDSKTK